MHPQCNPGGAKASPSRSEHDPQKTYEADLRGLLDLLLAEFPGVLTYREALTARVENPDDPLKAEAFGNAARGVVGAGLAVRQGELIFASRAARAMVDLGYHLG